MDDLTGIDLLVIIKEKFPEMKVIGITGYDLISTEKEPLGQFDAILKKPFESNDLLDTIERFLNS